VIGAKAERRVQVPPASLVAGGAVAVIAPQPRPGRQQDQHPFAGGLAEGLRRALRHAERQRERHDHQAGQDHQDAQRQQAGPLQGRP